MPTIKQHYPNAISIRELEQKITSELNLHGFILSRTIWGTSICADEVNNSFNLFSKLFAGPGPFRFGGISGYPFTGKTGIAAFASHIPDKGGAFILYGPHIGISKDGKLGVMHRQRQKMSSANCGSLVAGLNAIKEQTSFSSYSDSDYQQERVVNTLGRFKDEILAAEHPLKTSTEKMYDSIHQDFNEMLENSSKILSGYKVYLMGGILINTDWDKEDYFDIRGKKVLDFT